MRKQLILLLALLCAPVVLPGTELIHVFVTVPPQQTFVEQVGGPRVQVATLVGAGSSPHAYEPTPSQIARLADAEIYFGIGLPLEAVWLERIRAVNPDIHIVDLGAGIARRRIEVHVHENDHAGAEHAHDDDAESAQDHHLWTSPALAMRMAEQIAATLGSLDPEHVSEYQTRLAAFQAELQRLDADLHATLAELRHRRFLVYHPAWGYFADAYGLTQVPIEAAGKEPGPKRLAALIEQARHDNIRLILAQPQMSTKAATQVAREIGGRVAVVDPLALDYVATLRHLASLLATVDD